MDYTAYVRFTYWEGTYTGTCFGGVPHGSGEFKYENIVRSGDTFSGSYVGEWANGLLNGQGTLTEYKNGELIWIFEGGWKNSKFYGEGRVLGEDGNVLYEGFFVDPYIVDRMLSDAVSEYFSGYGMAPVNEQTRDYIENEIFGFFDEYGSPPSAEDPMSLYFDVERYLEDPSSVQPWLVQIPLRRIRDTRKEETTGYYMLEVFFTGADGQAYCGLMRGDDSYLSYADSLYALPVGTADIDGKTHIMCLLLNDWYNLKETAESQINANGGESPESEGTIDIAPQICRQAWTGTYTGTIIDGQPAGAGIFEGVSESDDAITISFDGEWRQGLPEGQGEITFYSNGEIIEFYKGEWINGMPDGQGKFTSLTNGAVAEVYDGGWKKGYRYGQAVVYDGNGEILFEGLFDNGHQVESLWPDAAVTYGDVLGDNVKRDYRDFIEEHVFDVFSAKYTDPIPDDLLIPDFDIDRFLSDPQSYEPGLVLVDSTTESFVVTDYMGHRVAEIVMNDSNHKYMCLMRWYDTESAIIESMYILPLGVADLDGEACIIGICVNNLKETPQFLKEGDTGELVTKMKLRMQELGYFSAGASLSDSYNATCAERVRQFQKVNGLEQTGEADPLTLTLLYSEFAQPKP